MSVGLILAAGGSRRLGQPKQLLNFQGQPLICHAVDQLTAAGIEHVVVVLGAHAAPIQEALGSRRYDHVEVILNEHWNRGQASSLSLGISYIEKLPSGYPWVTIALCDQPFVTDTHYRQLSELIEDTAVDVAATHYPAGGGVPAVIHRRRWPELLDTLAQDHGAKHWIRRLPPPRVKLVHTPGATMDIDTPEDLARLDAVTSGGSG